MMPSMHEANIESAIGVLLAIVYKEGQEAERHSGKRMQYTYEYHVDTPSEFRVIYA